MTATENARALGAIIAAAVTDAPGDVLELTAVPRTDASGLVLLEVSATWASGAATRHLVAVATLGDDEPEARRG